MWTGVPVPESFFERKAMERDRGSRRPREFPDTLQAPDDETSTAVPRNRMRSSASRTDKAVVLIPAFNRPEMMRESIDSVLAQTYSHFEVHVGLDGVAEPVRQVARSYADRPNVIVHDFPTNRGTYGTLENLLRATESAYVAVFSDDDVMEPTYLAECIASLTASPGTHPYAYSHVYYWYPDRLEPRTDCDVMNLNAIVFDRRYLDELLRRDGYVFEPRFQRFHADAVLLRKLGSRGPPIHVCKPLIRYRVHAGQQTRPQELPLRQILGLAHVLNAIGYPYTMRELVRRFLWFIGEKTRLSVAKRKLESTR